jgi:hypothetical protein
MHEGWLLPAINPYCTKIRPDWFKAARKETNIVESQHAHTNRQTRTQLPLLIAIERYGIFIEYIYLADTIVVLEQWTNES